MYFFLFVNEIYVILLQGVYFDDRRYLPISIIVKFPKSEVLVEPLIRDCYSGERVVESNVT